jgi:gluconokinase
MHDHLSSVGPRALIVMGVAGSGKSTLGTALAGEIGCPFLEGDDFHSPQAIERMRAGIPLADADRWPWLDRLGHAISDQVGSHRIVVAACSALRKVYRDRLREAIAAPVGFVLLDTDPQELSRRMSNRPHHYMPPSLLASQLETLERPEPDEHAIVLDARRPIADLCRQVLEWHYST